MIPMNASGVALINSVDSDAELNNSHRVQESAAPSSSMGNTLTVQHAQK